MNINLLAPITTNTSYGIVSINLLKQLSENNDLSVFPIGGIEISDEQYKDCIQNGLNNQAGFDNTAHSIRIFHQFSLAEHIGKGKHIGMPIFELDCFTEREIHHMKSQDQLLVCSHWAKRVCEDNGLKANVVPLGVDIDTFFPTRNKKSKETVFLNISKWEIRKGHDVLLQAFNNAFQVNDNVRLIMVPTNFFIGNGNKEWCDLYKSSKMGNKITILDRLPTQKEISLLINQSDCGIYPSRAEGWNLSLLETMACGKHCIATDYSGHTEFINENNCMLVTPSEMESAYDGVFFFNQGNWAALGESQIDQIVQHMRDVHRRVQDDSLGSNLAGITTAQKFSWPAAANKLMEVISK